MNVLSIIFLLMQMLVLKSFDCKLQGRIINGFAVDIKYFKYMASIQADGRHLCGGAIVSKNMVITAAHCDVYPASFYQLRVGSTYYDNGGRLLNISHAIKHPKYDRKSADYDISLFILQTPLDFSSNDENIAPLGLPTSNMVIPTGLGVTVAGWGTTNPNDDTETSTILRSAALRTIQTTECRRMFPPQAISDRMFCAQNFNERKDSCTGDSGGPLVYRNTLIGVVSWGISCADRTTPGVYTNIPIVRDFISKNWQ